MSLPSGSFTAKRLPVVMVHAEYFDMVVDAIAAERSQALGTRLCAFRSGEAERVEPAAMLGGFAFGKAPQQEEISVFP